MGKKTLVTISVIVVLLGGLIYMAVSSGQSTQAKRSYGQVQQDIKQGAHLYDVRTPQEYAAGRFAGAENFPLQTMQAGTLPNVPKDTLIYLHCQSGNRSSQAAQLLRGAGYTNVVDLGGLRDVQALGAKLNS